MWEDAIPKPMPETTQEAENLTPRPKARREDGRTGDNLILWAQILLCAAILAGVYAARALDLPVYAQLRTAFDRAMQE